MLRFGLCVGALTRQASQASDHYTFWYFWHPARRRLVSLLLGYSGQIQTKGCFSLVLVNLKTPPRTARAKAHTGLSNPPYISPAFERRSFEFDRRAVLRQIDIMQGSIDQIVKELEMIAAERVFKKSLSDGLLDTSRALKTIGKELKARRRLLARASGYPEVEQKRP
jgi:hypothetical protein